MSRAKRYWDAYRRFTDFPVISQSKTERNVGVIVYSFCFLLACGLLVSMFLGESQTYINYGASGGDFVRAVVHRPPDIVLCPSRHLWSERVHQVFYDEQLVKALNMTSDHINMITKMHQTPCVRETKCAELGERCANTLFAPLCRLLEVIVTNGKNNEEMSGQGPAKGGLKINERKAMVLEEAVRSGAVQMLWLAIIDSRYKDVQERFKNLEPNRPTVKEQNLISCYFYSNDAPDTFRDEECAEHQESFWLAQTYCSVIRGSKIKETSTPFIGFRERVKPATFRYWVGNLETTPLTEALLTTNFIGNTRAEQEERKKKLAPISLVSGVGHYSMIRWKEVTGMRLDCQPQPLIKGLQLPLDNCKGAIASEQAVTSWYYDVTYEKRPLPVVWIYSQSIRKVEKNMSFSAYTQFQIGAGLLSCFVGFSFLQIVELLLNSLKKLKIVPDRILGWTQIASLLSAIILTVSLTSLDLYWYFESRYTTIVTQKNETLDLPIVQLCSDNWSNFYFINTTKMAEFNASVNFYLFMRLAGWHVAPCVNVAYKERVVNGTLVSVEVKEWMRRNWEPKVGENTTCDPKYNPTCPQANCPWNDLILDDGYRALTGSKKIQRPWNRDYFGKIFHDIVEKDIEEVIETIGLADPSIAQLVEFFSLDPRQLIHCTINGRAWDDCGRFGKYFLETGNHDYCLSLRIPSEEAQKRIKNTDSEQSFQISYDSKAYEEHSDYGSYHGIGVQPEKERDKGFSHCDGELPRRRAVLEGGYVRSVCRADRSWKLRIAQPHWAKNYIQILHPRMGLISHQLHTLNLKRGFSAMLPLNESRCVSDNKPICRFPKEEATAVYKAIQYHLWCGCCYCLDEGESFMSHLEYIFGRKLSCCTPKQHIGCLETYQNAMKWNDEKEAFVEDRNYKIASDFMYRMRPFSNVELLKKMTPANISIWIGFGYESLTEKEASKLADWTRKCFKSPCEEKSYTLRSYQNEPTDEEVVNVTINFDSSVGVGAEEIDRLDPAQLLGILLCSYSVTIGIGVVGLLEISFVMISKIKGSTTLKLGKTIHEHLIRGLSPITKFATVGKVTPGECTAVAVAVGPNNSSARKDEQVMVESFGKHSIEKDIEAGGSNDQDNKITSTSEQVVVESFGKPSIEKDIEAGGSNDQDNKITSTSEQVVVESFGKPSIEKDIEAGGSNDQDNKITPTDDIIELDDKSIKKDKCSQEVEGANEENSDGGSHHVTLLVFLLVSFGLAIYLIVYLFSSLETEFTADIQVSPEYEKPSVAICVNSKERAESLWAALQLSKCWRESRGPNPCSSLFTTYIHAKKDQYCFLLDNSVVSESTSAPRLDRHQDDLRIEMPKEAPGANLYVNGLNNSKAENVNAIFEWKRQNVTISYSVEAYQQESGCVSEVPTKQCTECALPEAISQSYPVECCTSTKKAPEFVPEKTCYEQHFGVSYAPSKAGEGSFKSLSIRASSDFLIIFKVKSKHSIQWLISMTGGFISSFTEITFLNILALSVYLAWKTKTGLKKAETIKKTTTDAERNIDAETCEEKQSEEKTVDN